MYGHSFDVPGEADLTLAYGVLDAASLQPLVLTPLLPQGVKSSSAELALATPGPWELLVNGQGVASGAQAPAQPFSVPLEKGMNVLALRLTKGTVALQGKLGDFTFDAANWRMAPADVADPVSPSVDDGTWPLAPKLGDHATLGAIVGHADQPVVLRRTLLVEHTRVWPTPEPAYTLAQGVTQHMTFRTEGLKGRKLDGWETFIAVPPGFEVVGSTGFYGKNPGIPKWTTTQLGEQTVQGRKMRVAKVAADQPLRDGAALHHVGVRGLRAQRRRRRFCAGRKAGVRVGSETQPTAAQRRNSCTGRRPTTAVSSRRRRRSRCGSCRRSRARSARRSSGSCGVDGCRTWTTWACGSRSSTAPAPPASTTSSPATAGPRIMPPASA